MSYAQAPVGGTVAPVVYYGVAIEDPLVAEQVKKVMMAAAACLAMGVCSQLGSAINGVGGGALIGLVFVWMVPSCGYFGAKQKNRGLLCCFWCCSGWNAVWAFLMFGSGIWIVTGQPFLFQVASDINKCCDDLATKNAWAGDISTAVCDGDTIHIEPGEVPGEPTVSGDVEYQMYPYPNSPMCIGVSDGQASLLSPPNTVGECYSALQCHNFRSAVKPFLGDGGGFFYVLLGFFLVQALLGAASCILGCNLWNNPYFKVGYQTAGIQQPMQPTMG